MDKDRLAEVYVAENSLEAHFLKNLLEDEGIDVEVVGEGLAFAMGDLPLGWPTMPRLWVRQEDAANAKALIGDWEKQRRERRERGDEESEV
jgi:hypothetical protein